MTLDDIARAFDQAIRDTIADKLKKRGERFACITPPPAGRSFASGWIYAHRARLDRCPLSHLVMLAPANHGSALAQLGKGRLSRMKFFFRAPNRASGSSIG